jgi:hypothetical protein
MAQNIYNIPLMWLMLPGTPAYSRLNDASILQIVTNSKHSKHKEQAHTAYLKNPINQPSLEISHAISLSSSNL